MKNAPNHQFALLDALRGIAALEVVEYHLHDYFGRNLFPHGYLAVDFFFMLSGFVLTFAYQNRLDAGWSTWHFMKVRLVRLYPLYLFGLILGFLLYLLDIRAPGAHVAPPLLALILALGLLVLPTPGGLVARNNSIFPFDYPAWSLFYEILANLYHALLLRRRSRTTLTLSLGLCAIALVAVALHFHTVNVGAEWPMLLFGPVRAAFGYTAGVLLYSLWKSRKPAIPAGSAIAVVLLIATLAIPTPAAFNTLFDLAAILIVFPALLWIAASSQVSVRVLPAAHILGQSSYAIYVLHAPFANFFERLWLHLRHHAIDRDVPLAGCLYLVSLTLFAILIDQIYDTKVRSYLQTHLLRRPA